MGREMRRETFREPADRILPREVEGESSEAICNVLGVSYTNFRVLMYRARMPFVPRYSDTDLGSELV